MHRREAETRVVLQVRSQTQRPAFTIDPPRMWDVDDSGCINLQEMTNIVATMDDVEGVEQEPKVNFSIS